MQANPIDLFSQPDDSSGVYTVDGWGVKIYVHRKHLVIEDGIGRTRRTRRYHKATSGLKRLVIIGHSGYITFEAARWLADAKVQVVHLDSEGRILSVSAQSPDLPALRRAQVDAATSKTGVEVARYLLAAKITGQAQVANRLGAGPDELLGVAQLLEKATSLDELRIAEIQAAGTYWKAWTDVSITFARATAERVPEHWLTFGQRRSPLTASSRRAINPINALLNYLYALLEAEARIALISVGLDPGLGIIHLDRKARASFADDLMEAARPAVDHHVLDLIDGHLFGQGDFTETRAGECRIGPRLAHHLSQTTTIWFQHLAEPAEAVARIIAGSTPKGTTGLPTPLTQQKRRQKSASPWAVNTKPARPTRSCEQCGQPVAGNRRNCPTCLEARRRDDEWLRGARQRLAGLRGKGVDPAHGGTAREKRAAKVSAENQKSRDWNRINQARPDPTQFTREILPLLEKVSPGQMSQATGLSTDYCSKIKRGLKVPHVRHWMTLKGLTATRSPEGARKVADTHEEGIAR